MTFFVILVIIVIAIAVSNSASKKKREEEERQQAQKAKADVAAALPSICRLLESLDILESVLKAHDERLHFWRNIALSLKTDDTVFELQYVIIRSGRNPEVKKHLDSITLERGWRNYAKESGKPLSTIRSANDDAVWCDLPDEQLEMLYDMTIYFDEERDKDNDITLKGSLPLRFGNPSSRGAYIYKSNMYVKVLAEAIHAKCPEYGFQADTYGINFHDKNGVVSYDGI